MAKPTLKLETEAQQIADRLLKKLNDPNLSESDMARILTDLKTLHRLDPDAIRLRRISPEVAELLRRQAKELDILMTQYAEGKISEAEAKKRHERISKKYYEQFKEAAPEIAHWGIRGIAAAHAIKRWGPKVAEWAIKAWEAEWLANIGRFAVYCGRMVRGIVIAGGAALASETVGTVTIAAVVLDATVSAAALGVEKLYIEPKTKELARIKRTGIIKKILWEEIKLGRAFDRYHALFKQLSAKEDTRAPASALLSAMDEAEGTKRAELIALFEGAQAVWVAGGRTESEVNGPDYLAWLLDSAKRSKLIK